VIKKENKTGRQRKEKEDFNVRKTGCSFRTPGGPSKSFKGAKEKHKAFFHLKIKKTEIFRLSSNNFICIRIRIRQEVRIRIHQQAPNKSGFDFTVTSQQMFQTEHAAVRTRVADPDLH
jgi:hypothetical protein